MIRSAAKNLGWVCVIVDPNDYTDLVDCIDNNSEVSYDFRLAMACKAFATTSQYETMINNYLNTETFPDQMDLTYKKYSDLRYGENQNIFYIPHDFHSLPLLEAFLLHQGYNYDIHLRE